MIIPRSQVYVPSFKSGRGFRFPLLRKHDAHILFPFDARLVPGDLEGRLLPQTRPFGPLSSPPLAVWVL